MLPRLSAMWLVLIVGLLFCSIAPGGPTTAPSAEQLLQGTVSFELPEAPFSEMVTRFQDSFGLNVFVNWNALQQYGIVPDQKIAIKPVLRNVPLRKVLDLILDQVSAATCGVARLGWIVEDNIVYVSTEDDIHDRQTKMTSQRQKARETEVQINLVDRMKDTYFDPAAAGVVAIGAIKGELQRSNQDVIAGLEDLLGKTRAQGLRNALHMTLRDLYAQAGRQEEVMEHLTQMLCENDQECVNATRLAAPAPADRRSGPEPVSRRQ